MPNRIVRESILGSNKVNSLGWAAEVFYRRLMSIVDDFGRHEMNITLLRSKLYPLLVDKVSLADVEKWLAECAGAGLVSCYEVVSKQYLEITEFNQTLRIKKSKCPEPPGKQMQADASRLPQMQADVVRKETNRNESETNRGGSTRPPKISTAKKADEHIADIQQSSDQKFKLLRILRGKIAGAMEPDMFKHLDAFAGKFDVKYPEGETLQKFGLEWGWYVTDLKIGKFDQQLKPQQNRINESRNKPDLSR